MRKWAGRYCTDKVHDLENQPRKGRTPVFDAKVAMHIIKIAYEVPVERGRSLDKCDCTKIAKELIRTKVVSSISTETVRRILINQKLKLWRYHHMWLSEKKPHDQEFCNCVRDIIDLYFRELNL